jgi:peptidoglycan LD-endopeptidase LytH
MGRYAAAAKRFTFVVYMLCIHALLIFLLLDKFVLNKALLTEWKPDFSSDAGIQASPLPTPGPETTPVPGSAPEPSPSMEPPPSSSATDAIRIIVPVQGIKPDQLADTFTQSRSEGRTHDAIDIMAPAGTPVLAATDGEIVKFFESVKGGITIYQITTNRKYFLYYAHLQRRADGIFEHQFVKAGTIIGYVGDTGNAGVGNNHLHFAISVVVDPKRFWEGPNINPYDILRGNANLR